MIANTKGMEEVVSRDKHRRVERGEAEPSSSSFGRRFHVAGLVMVDGVHYERPPGSQDSTLFVSIVAYITSWSLSF